MSDSDSMLTGSHSAKARQVSASDSDRDPRVAGAWTPSVAAALDEDALRRLAEMIGDQEELGVMLDEFISDTVSLLDRLRTAVADIPPDRASVRFEAHRLKSSAAIVGAITLSSHAARMEQSAETASDGELELQIADVHAAARDAFRMIGRARAQAP